MMEACPNCANPVQVRGLQPGAVLVCAFCIEVLILGHDQVPHHASAQEQASFPPEMRAEIEAFQKRILVHRTEGDMPS